MNSMPQQGQEAALDLILERSQVSGEVQLSAWTAFFEAKTPSQFYAAFDSLKLPTNTKAALFDLRFKGIVGAEGQPPRERREGVSTFAGETRPWHRRPLADIEALTPVRREAITPFGKFEAGLTKGIARGISGLTTPENVGLLGTMKAAPKILGAAAGGAAATAAGVYFTAQMALNLISSIPAAKEAWQRGDYTALGGIVGEDVVTAALIGHGGKETRRAGKPALAEVPKSPRPGPIRVLEQEQLPPRAAKERPPAPTPGAARSTALTVIPESGRIYMPRGRIGIQATPPRLEQGASIPVERIIEDMRNRVALEAAIENSRPLLERVAEETEALPPVPTPNSKGIPAPKSYRGRGKRLPNPR